jgi:hypothetical protein
MLVTANPERRLEVAEATEVRVAQPPFAVRQAKMEALSQELESSVADGLRIRTEFIRTELELGFTFLDLAKTRIGLRSRACISGAVAALEAADRFLRMTPRLSDAVGDEIYGQRDELRRRLREFFWRAFAPK